jgi:hypothetical protein
MQSLQNFFRHYEVWWIMPLANCSDVRYVVLCKFITAFHAVAVVLPLCIHIWNTVNNNMLHRHHFLSSLVTVASVGKICTHDFLIIEYNAEFYFKVY